MKSLVQYILETCVVTSNAKKIKYCGCTIWQVKHGDWCVAVDSEVDSEDDCRVNYIADTLDNAKKYARKYGTKSIEEDKNDIVTPIRKKYINENNPTADDWNTLRKGMKHRDDHEAIIDLIYNGDISATNINIDGLGSCSVYIQTPQNEWGEWVDVWISHDDVNVDWNDIYMDDIKNDDTVFDIVTSEAITYAKEMGVIAQSEDGRWTAANNPLK